MGAKWLRPADWRLNLELDTDNQEARADATVDFYQPHSGYPVIELLPTPTSVFLDGIIGVSDH
jgi:hypothetical protein